MIAVSARSFENEFDNVDIVSEKMERSSLARVLQVTSHVQDLGTDFVFYVETSQHL